MDFMALTQQRFSCRAYTKAPVSREDILKIAEAARIAPSGRNRQNWQFYYTELGGRGNEFVTACYGQKFVGDAYGFFVICDRTDDFVLRGGQNGATVDGSIATTYMMLAATQLGLGTCWIGSYYPERIRALLAIPLKDLPLVHL